MPEWLHATKLRIKALFHRRRSAREMAEELAFHRAMLQEKMERNGANAEEANSGVRQTFGDERRWHERLTELWQFRWLENLWRDVSFGIRVLRKSPGFTTVALLTLVLGIGANTAIFSLINALLLRPLPVPAPEKLVLLGAHEGDTNYTFSSPLFRSLEKRTDIFQSVFAYSDHPFQIKTVDGVQNVGGSFVSGDFFNALQTRPQLGRYLEPGDDRPGGNPSGYAAVISDQFWKTWFQRSPDVVGRKLTLDNVPFTIVGVMPASFIGANPVMIAEIYAPLTIGEMAKNPFGRQENGFNSWWLTIAARRREGMSLEETNAALRAASRSVVEAAGAPADMLQKEKSGKYYFVSEPDSKGYSYLRERFSQPLLLIFGLCGAVLLLACLNLASLLMARAAAREREMATRLAIGASRRRLIQQLLTESLLLASSGAIVGLAISPLASKALGAMLAHGSRGSHIDTSLDMRVCLFATGIALFSALLVGVFPALASTGKTVSTHLKDSAATFRASRNRRIIPRVLLSAEVALALMVVVGAGLLAVSLVRLYSVRKGFDPKGVVLASLSMAKQPLEGDPLTRLYQELAEAYAHVQGVKSVSYADVTPLSDSFMIYSISVPGKENIPLHMARIGPDYFQTLHISLLAGREFLWSDSPASGPKLIINESAARQAFPDGQALGRHLNIAGKDHEVIGIVGDAKYEDLRRQDPPTAYLAITQESTVLPKMSYDVILRFDGTAAPVLSAVRDTTRRLAPDVPLPEFTSFNSQIADSIASDRLMAILAVFFAVCALIVTGIGLYGTLAYTTARRTSEIGIRMALGARRSQITFLIFRENAMIAIIGSLVGLVVALLSGRLLATQLYNTSSHDLPVMLLSVAALGLIACVASLLPALHAARIEPMAAIRCE